MAFTIGYSPSERIKLADAAMREFKAIWGRYPNSVASWNLDSITMLHLTDRYQIDAYAVCRDQIATDGFTIWGAPIAGYYPSKTNCWSPALSRDNQISTPVFRMLGQDPVYYYQNGFKLPDGRVIHEPDTMEPTWTSGRSPLFVRRFLDMISEAPSLKFAYAQMGQENSFPWPGTAEAYPMQMRALAQLRDAGLAHVETMGESGRRFKRSFASTPEQAQVMLDDPFGNTDPAEGSIWYQSRFYRADLHIEGDLPFFRDLTTYSDRNPQPFLTEATRENDVEQRMPAFLDGYHWRKSPSPPDKIGAGGFFQVSGQRLRLSGRPRVQERGSNLSAEFATQNGGTLHVTFEPSKISIRLTPTHRGPLSLSFEWDPAKAALTEARPQRVLFRQGRFEYGLEILRGVASRTVDGWTVTEDKGEISLQLAQPI